MDKCIHFKEEFPFLQSSGSGGFEIEMVPICTRTEKEDLGMSNALLPCGGFPENCPFRVQENGFFQF